jgi:UDP-glucose 4-epimerase
VVKYLITGGAGFIGSHLCHHLENNGDEVIVIDNLSNGNPAGLSQNVKLIVGDITNPRLITESLNGVSGCFHLAATTSAAAYNQDWTAATLSNLAGSVTVLQQLSYFNIPVVFASSAAVYGAKRMLPLIETMPTSPISGYGTDKLGLELHAKAMAKSIGLVFIGLRFFNIYGPQKENELAPKDVTSSFFTRMIKERPVEISGDGNQTRDFVFVTDAVQALSAAMNYAQEGECGFFNVCSGTQVSMNKLALEVGRVLEAPVIKKYYEIQTQEIRHSFGDPTNASKHLHFNTKITLEKGLAQMARWVKQVELATRI